MKFGRYEILKELGKGSMGIVYKAHDPEIDRMVALKVLRQDQVSSKDAVQRFLKEAKAIGRLNHPNIVIVYDVGQDHGTVYIAMELIEGQSLKEIIKSKRLNLEDIVHICYQVAIGLDYAHEQGIVHRDIKPANIMLTKDQTVKITDFGIAHVDDSSLIQQTQAGVILGTPVYMSPEQVMGKKVDGRSDLYSLGAIIFELTTGEKPFKEPSLAALFNAIIHKDPKKPFLADSSLTKSASLPLSDLIMKALSKNPDNRFQRGKELAAALNKVLEQTTQPPSEAKSKAGLKKIYVIFSILLLSVAMGGYLYYAKHRDSINNQPEVGSVSNSDNSKQKIPTGILNIKTNPSDAQVFVNGEFKGRAPIKINVQTGKHELRVIRQGYFDWEAQMKVDKPGEIPVFVRLIPMEEDTK